MTLEDAVRDFVVWEPGESLICVLCQRKRGGADPPGNWFRHSPSQRRRIPIIGPAGALGYLEYVHE